MDSPQKLNHTDASALPMLPRSGKDREKLVHLPREWPESSSNVRRLPFGIACRSIFGVVLLLCSTAFLGFAIAVTSYDQQSTAEHPKTTQLLVNATKYGPTVFPILFAAVIGSVAHALLVWRLEQGARIGTLDLLATSTSFTSTIVSQFELRSLSVLGLGLALLWALSPVGGQASLRLMTIGEKAIESNETVDYLAPNIHNKTIFSPTVMSWYFNPLFAGTLLTSWETKRSPVDGWANVKIPRIEASEDDGKMPNSEGWFDVDLNTRSSSLATWSSLVGVPMRGLGGHADNYDLVTSLQTQYLSLDCIYSTTFDDVTKLPVNTTLLAGDYSNMLWWSTNAYYNRFQEKIDGLTPLEFTYAVSNLTNLTEGNRGHVKEYSVVIECSITTSYVETEVTCPRNQDCRATRTRRSLLDHPSKNWTPFDMDPHVWPEFAANYIKTFSSGADQWSNTSYNSVTTNWIDLYLTNPGLQVGLEEMDNPNWNYKAASDADFSSRFTQLFNSYWTIMDAVYTLANGISNGTALYTDTAPSFALNDGSRIMRYIERTSREDAKACIWRAEGTKTTYEEVVVAHKAWVAILCIISTLLIAASLLSPIIRIFLTTGPDVSMNVSSLATRDNPYIKVPDRGSYMDAADRARIFKDVKVRFGDVEGDEQVGKLAIGMCRDDAVVIERTSKARLYK